MSFFFQFYCESATISNPLNIKGTRKTMPIGFFDRGTWIPDSSR